MGLGMAKVDHGFHFKRRKWAGMMQRGYRRVNDHKVKVVEAKIQWFIACVTFPDLCTQGARHNGRMKKRLEFWKSLMQLCLFIIYKYFTNNRSSNGGL
jgi:hypothetical protein